MRRLQRPGPEGVEGCWVVLFRRSSQNQPIEVGQDPSSFEYPRPGYPRFSGSERSGHWRPLLEGGKRRCAALAEVNLSMDASNLKEEVVTQRLQQHADAFRDSSFDNVKKETDILTGQRRQRLDAAALERDERTFIERIEGLVGNKSTPAIRQLRPTLKKTKSMPKLLGQRVPDSKPKLAGKPTAVLEQISRQMAQEVRAETLEINMEVEKVTWTQVSAGNLLGGLG
ncbi:unnamed protein product [Durusdinium trenchii]|uniref:Uncharacterized protein n=1 Tax=Durusdinium trenchii TaxID=1381693 RepID=A0ABP0QLS1_9DINO